MRTKFNVAILKHGSESNDILKAIASHNGGEVPLCVEDFISWGQMRRALFPLGNAGFYIERTEEPQELRVTEDGGKTFTLIIQEITIEELVETENN